MNILAIGAHADDLELHCGGTLARCAQRGDRVTMCVVTDGRGNPQGDAETIIATRKAEAEAAAAVIGARLRMLGVPDGSVWVDEATRHLFIEAIREAQPDLVITHPPDDYHPDHKATSRLVMDAAQVARTANYPSRYAPHLATMPIAFMEPDRGVGFVPEDYVDITEVWAHKLAMLDVHRSQYMPAGYTAASVLPSEDNPFHRYVEAVNRFRGLAANVLYAEGFCFWRAAGRVATRRLLP
jgi:LmbE family N-acetylglucosaminyl deacetylase